MGARVFASTADERSAIMRSLDRLSAHGSAAGEVAEAACTLLANMTGACAAAYRTDPGGDIHLLAASQGCDLPRRVTPRAGGMVATSMTRGDIVSSRMASVEPELEAAGHPFSFAVAGPSECEHRSVVVLAGDAQAAVSVAVSSLPLGIVEVLDRVLAGAPSA